MAKNNFHEHYLNESVEPPSPRSTGLVFAVVSLIVALLWRNTLYIVFPFLVLACALILMSLVAPRLLGPLNRAWFRFGLLLHKVVNPVVLFLLFAIVFVPTGLVMRLFYDPLRLKSGRRDSTYWIDCSAAETPKPSMRNQF